MNKLNFKEGVKFLYFGSLCELCLMGLAFIMGFLDLIVGEIEIFTGIMSILILLAYLAALVLKLLGALKARKEETNLTYAFYTIIGVLALSAINMILNMAAYNKYVNGIISIIVGVGELAFMYFIIVGISNVFKSQGNNEIVEYAKKALYIILGAAGLAFLLNSVNCFLNYGTAMGVIDVIATACSIVAVVFMFLFLKKSLAELSTNNQAEVQASEAKEEAVEE